MSEMPRALPALLRVNHPDPATRMRAVNALVIAYANIAIGVVSLYPLSQIPGGATIALIAGLGTAGGLLAVLLIRRGHVTAGLYVLIGFFLAAFAAVPLVVKDARLSAVYCSIAVVIAGVTLGRVGVAIVTVLALTIAVVGTALYPPVDPPVGPREIITSAVILIVINLATALLGLWGQRQETRRADAAARRSTELAERLQRSNAELEQRVAERTEELQRALSQQETLVAELAERSVRDPLTGLHNRRHADDELPRLVASAERHGYPVTLAMADLDHFKVVNDQHSYAVGDEVLRTFARLLTDNARSTDLVVRYGGEEFLLVMPQTTIEQAATVCERLRRAVADHRWGEIVPGLAVTVSVGVSSTPTHPGLVTLVAAADAALHQAKRQGRDQVVTAPRPTGAPAPATV
ncbi:MAG: diguanylate cyclase [Candidatus Nanopelagicales bacterium]